MTHAELVERGVRWLRGRAHNCTVVFAEISTRLFVVPDVLGFSAGGESTHVECKVSRKDFKKDKTKLSHSDPRLAIGDYRWYLTPPGLLSPQDIPEGWGLAEVQQRRIIQVVPALLLENRIHRPELSILVAAVRRHELGVPWYEERAKFEPYLETRRRKK